MNWEPLTVPAWKIDNVTASNTPYFYTFTRNEPFTDANGWTVWDAAAESVEKEIEHQRQVDNEFKELLEAANG